MACDTHGFNPAHVTLYGGLEEAVMIQGFKGWINGARRRGANQIEGRTWVYNSYEAMREWFPYWTAAKIRRVCDSLVNQGVLLKEQWDKTKGDARNYFAFADEREFLCLGEPQTQRPEVTKEPAESDRWGGDEFDRPLPESTDALPDSADVIGTVAFSSSGETNLLIVPVDSTEVRTDVSVKSTAECVPETESHKPVELLPDGTRRFTDEELLALDEALERMGGRWREHARKDELFECRRLFTNGCSVALFRQIADEVFNDPNVPKVTSLKFIVCRAQGRMEKIAHDEQPRNPDHARDARPSQGSRSRYPGSPASRDSRTPTGRGGAPAASRVQYQDREHAAEYDWDAL